MKNSVNKSRPDFPPLRFQVNPRRIQPENTIRGKKYSDADAPPGLTAPDGCRYTWNEKTNRLYLHIYSWPFRYLELPGLGGKVKYAQLLRDMSEIQFDEASAAATKKADTSVGNISLKLPVQKPDDVVPVVEIILKDPLK